MSDSTPKRTPATPDSGQLPPTLRERIARIPIWWLMSGAFHALVIGWLIFFSPVRIINLEERKTEFTAGSAQIQEVMDQVRDRQAELLASQVGDLQEILMQLSELEARKLSEFEKFTAEFAQEAPMLAEQDQAAAIKAQTDAMSAQADSVPALAEAHQRQTNEAWKPFAAVQKKVEDAQDRASQPMERAIQALTMSDSVYEAARQAQADANAKQLRANQVQLAAAAARETAQGDVENARNKRRDSDRNNESVKRVETELLNAKTNSQSAKVEEADAKAEFTQAQTNVVQAKADSEQAKAASNQARANYDKLDGKDPNKKTAKETSNKAQDFANQARSQADRAQDKFNQIKNRAESAQRKVEQKQNDVARAESRLKEEQARAEKAKNEAELATVKADESEAKLDQTQSDARTLQAAARLAQEQARIALATARQSGVTNGLAAATNHFEVNTNLLANMPSVYGMHIAEVYQTAVATESQATEAYRKIRATELAMVRRIPLARAMELTDVAKVVRPNLKPALQAKAATGEDVVAVREAVQTANSEVNAMVTLGTSLLLQAKGLDHGGPGGTEGATVSLEWIKAQSEQTQAMETLAAEDSNDRAKDLTGAMQGQAAGDGTSKGQPKGNAPAAAAGNGPQGGRSAGGGYGFGGAPAFPKKLPALPGRKVKAGADSAGWMYVDSWYVIGPFDNARRENIEKKFPPETVVDLNATYSGKDNQSVRWEFTQTGEPRVTPTFRHFHPEIRRPAPPGDYWTAGLEYIIYYGYTELHFEQPCDLWIAVGSDDFSKVWIEDQLVWASGKNQKSWRVDEGLRKVHFKQGLNRVLFRVENGWHASEFSLVICLK